MAKSHNENSFSIRIDRSLLPELDKRRGEMSPTAYIKEKIELHLSNPDDWKDSIERLEKQIAGLVTDNHLLRMALCHGLAETWHQLAYRLECHIPIAETDDDLVSREQTLNKMTEILSDYLKQRKAV